MARMYGKSKGKSGSSKPVVKENPSWVSHKAAEIETLVAKFAKEKLSGSEIGIKLRDQYGIPSVKAATGKTISTVLEEKKVAKELPQDLLDVIAKWVLINKHMESNRQDKTAKRGLQLTQARINRLMKYYKGTGKLAQNWKFQSDRAGMYLE